MPHDVTMPQLGMAQDAGRLTQWLKAPGDAVSKGDALFEVETDKATMEVEAQASGYLTHVTASEGEDVPVGQTIARISDSADAAGDNPDATEAPAADTLPEGHPVTMPQLGMAQDTGLLVAWLKSPGDAVAADDGLFEVETDKSTMEVPAGRDGFLAATLAQAGEEVSVGTPVAIISDRKPDAPVARKAQKADKPETPPLPMEVNVPAQKAVVAAAPGLGKLTPQGRILASPKARRLALEEGLDLERLAKAGHPQPFHVADLEVLRALPTEIAPVAAAAQAARRLTATTQSDGLAEFAAWAAREHGLEDADALLAGIAGHGHARVVAIERFGVRRAYALPRTRALSLVTRTDDAPELILRDLRGTAVHSIEMGAEDTPVLTLMRQDVGTRQDVGLVITLECAPTQLSAPEAILLLTEFAGRAEHPLRLLL